MRGREEENREDNENEEQRQQPEQQIQFDIYIWDISNVVRLRRVQFNH